MFPVSKPPSKRKRDIERSTNFRIRRGAESMAKLDKMFDELLYAGSVFTEKVKDPDLHERIEIQPKIVSSLNGFYYSDGPIASIQTDQPQIPYVVDFTDCETGIYSVNEDLVTTDPAIDEIMGSETTVVIENGEVLEQPIQLIVQEGTNNKPSAHAGLFNDYLNFVHIDIKELPAVRAKTITLESDTMKTYVKYYDDSDVDVTPRNIIKHDAHFSYLFEKLSYYKDKNRSYDVDKLWRDCNYTYKYCQSFPSNFKDAYNICLDKEKGKCNAIRCFGELLGYFGKLSIFEFIELTRCNGRKVIIYDYFSREDHNGIPQKGIVGYCLKEKRIKEFYYRNRPLKLTV